jgi:hypothetical protein
MFSKNRWCCYFFASNIDVLARHYSRTQAKIAPNPPVDELYCGGSRNACAGLSSPGRASARP